MDLSKAFDCLNHELFIAKLEACGLSGSALKLVHDYLSNKKQHFRSMGHLVPGRNQSRAFCRVLFWGPSYLMYL